MMKALASRAIVLSCLLFVAILGLASAAEWDVNSYVSTANNPNFGTVMVPHPPIKVQAVIPVEDKKYNETKTTPGPQCESMGDCSSCIGLHFCLWTANKQCIRAGTARALRLQFRRKAFAVCVNTNERLQTVDVEIPPKRKLYEAEQAQPSVNSLQTELHGVPVVVDPRLQPKVVYPVNAIREELVLPGEEPVKNRNVFEVNNLHK